MQRQTFISTWCERVIEAGWLLALALIPIYFNLLSARHFEPDKATTLRALVLMMAGAALVRALERLNTRPEPPPSQSGDSPAQPAAANPFGGLWRRLQSIPLAVPMGFYSLVFLFTTITSVVPHTSFWGSYQRLQGTYTNLSYVLLAVIIIATLRRREQLERLISVALLTALVVSGYGIVQHLQLDPLPWRGDVITRVASTMGNSIFVAAYLIMIVPLVLYRLVANANEARHAPPTSNMRNDLLWAFAQLLIIVGTLALIFAVVKFGSVVRTTDFRYWWVFPGAIIVATSFWTLLTLQPEQDEKRLAVPIWPGVLLILYLGFFGATFGLSVGSETQVIDDRMVNGLDWWIWLLGSIAALSSAYAAMLVLPRRAPTPSSVSRWVQVAGMGVLTGILLITIIFTQSRGPWLGIAAGLFVFFLLLLWQAIRRAQMLEQVVLARRLRLVLGSWLTLTLLVGGFLVAFNVWDAPFFQPLRSMPYIGRMGTLLDVNRGTGLVRRLIWIGDEHAGGAVALITADPVRTIIGWGPESMFVAYNAFYPPALANIESRGASPDRSHQAILDELVTKGFLGLVTYFFLLISFFALAWRLMRNIDEWRWQVFFIACMSIIVAHFVEGLTGIPIVSTLMMLWVTLGITAVGGMLAGQYVIGSPASEAPKNEPVVDAVALAADAGGEPGEGGEPASEPAADLAGKRKGAKNGRRAKRSAPTGRGPARVAARRSATPTALNPATLGLYALILALTFGGIWWFNLSTVYADMRFHEGQAFSEQPSAGLREQIVAMQKFIETINSNPREDFYYLNLGRTMMSIAELQRSEGVPVGQENPDVRVQDLLRLGDTTAVATFVQSTSPLEMMSYAEAVLRRARDLNEMNKDHYANLARLNNFWFNWTQQPEKMAQASEWYSRANQVAPQDVALLNEHASVLLLLSSAESNSGNSAASATYLDEAAALLERSRLLDPQYSDTTVRLAELYRQQERLAEATDMYIEVLQASPRQLTPVIEQVANSLEGEPELLARLRDAYAAQAEGSGDALLHAITGLLAVRSGDLELATAQYAQATELDPASLDHRRNYTIVLSDTGRFGEALAAAEQGLALAQGQEGREMVVAQFSYLINLLQPKVAGGE